MATERRQNRNLKPFRKGQGGRPRGARNRISGDIQKLAEELGQEHGDAAKEAWLRGLKARPPYSARYLELLLERNLGKVPQPLNVKVSQPLTIELPHRPETEAEDS